jgi:hypothetical protein
MHRSLRGKRLFSELRGILIAFGMFFAAAAADAPTTPPPGEIQNVPPDQALAILGEKVTDQDGKDMGRLVDVLVGQDGQPQAAVIDFGGFLGVGSRKIAVQWNTLHFAPGTAKRPVTLSLTPDQIKAAPEFKGVAKPAAVVAAPQPQPQSSSTDIPANPPPPVGDTQAPPAPQPPAGSTDAEPSPAPK